MKLIEITIFAVFVGLVITLVTYDGDEPICKAGYQHTYNVITGHHAQLIDENGHGIRCKKIALSS